MATEVIDGASGEILREGEFVKLYKEAFNNGCGLTRLETDVWVFVLFRMNDRNQTKLLPGERAKFIEERKINRAMFTDSITRLKKLGYLASIGVGDYLINPKVATRSKWVDTCKIIFANRDIVEEMERKRKEAFKK